MNTKQNFCKSLCIVFTILLHSIPSLAEVLTIFHTHFWHRCQVHAPVNSSDYKDMEVDHSMKQMFAMLHRKTIFILQRDTDKNQMLAFLSTDYPFDLFYLPGEFDCSDVNNKVKSAVHNLIWSHQYWFTVLSLNICMYLLFFGDSVGKINNQLTRLYSDSCPLCLEVCVQTVCMKYHQLWCWWLHDISITSTSACNVIFTTFRDPHQHQRCALLSTFWLLRSSSQSICSCCNDQMRNKEMPE